MQGESTRPGRRRDRPPRSSRRHGRRDRSRSSEEWPQRWRRCAGRRAPHPSPRRSPLPSRRSSCCAEPAPVEGDVAGDRTDSRSTSPRQSGSGRRRARRVPQRSSGSCPTGRCRQLPCRAGAAKHRWRGQPPTSCPAAANETRGPRGREHILMARNSSRCCTWITLRVPALGVTVADHREAVGADGERGVLADGVGRVVDGGDGPAGRAGGVVALGDLEVAGGVVAVADDREAVGADGERRVRADVRRVSTVVIVSSPPSRRRRCT